MSKVDNVLLSFDILEDEEARISEVNAWLENHPFKPGTLCSLDGCEGGYKGLETPLFLGALNYFPEAEFLPFLATLPWDYPEGVQYLIKRQEDDRFEIINLVGSKAWTDRPVTT